ncbi:hypothetical protein M0802_002974 [Mischocyttarus mexicanus]|nr:hypothetical protein M0802_002974 [Mischocyttarus mexicanus]
MWWGEVVVVGSSSTREGPGTKEKGCVVSGRAGLAPRSGGGKYKRMVGLLPRGNQKSSLFYCSWRDFQEGGMTFT